MQDCWSSCKALHTTFTLYYHPIIKDQACLTPTWTFTSPVYIMYTRIIPFSLDDYLRSGNVILPFTVLLTNWAYFVYCYADIC